MMLPNRTFCREHVYAKHVHDGIQFDGLREVFPSIAHLIDDVWRAREEVRSSPGRIDKCIGPELGERLV